MVDRIIVMRDGSIQEIGSYSELNKVGGAFAKFIETYLQEYNDDENEDPEGKNDLTIQNELFKLLDTCTNII